MLKVFPDFSVSYKSTYGTIESSWKREGKEIAYRAVVPDNSQATLVIEIPKGKSLFENGVKRSELKGKVNVPLPHGVHNFVIR
ncbi:MAG: hypothetical protein NVV59_09060 [Chitinophagaceae bacterium]|nr:hypothetical protein [Chitinophagaceae bacterium]